MNDIRKRIALLEWDLQNVQNAETRELKLKQLECLKRSLEVQNGL